jgi:tetratricopeptide (TPR) repeat protein
MSTSHGWVTRDGADSDRVMNTKSDIFGHRRSLTTILLAIVILPSICRSPAEAEDRVFLRASNGQEETRVVGEVEEFTGVELVMRHLSGRQQTFKSDRVVRVESNWSAPHQLALTKFQQREYQASLDAYLQALRGEKRKWVQRRQLAKITWCYRNLGKIERASEAFLALYKSDPTTMHFAAIPLVWIGAPPDVAVERRATTLLADGKQPAGQLIGASWLLTTGRRTEALQTLRTLTNAEDARIIFLAEAQTWRTQQATLTDADVTRLRTRIEAMPQAIRAGPYFLLGTAQSRLGQPTQAALALMRVRINFPEDRLLSAQALLAAGTELATINRPDEARGLYREVIVDYADTPAATTARQRHAALSGANASRTNPRAAPPDGQSQPRGNKPNGS